MTDLEKIIDEAVNLMNRTDDPNELENVKARYMGKNGILTELLKSIKPKIC